MRSSFVAAALLMFVAAPAQAANPIAKQMLSVARRAGVSFSIASVCGGSTGNLATFHPHTRHMCMSERVMGSGKESAFKTLTHEMVHVAQSCLGNKSVLLTAVERGVISMTTAKRLLKNRIHSQDLEGHVRRVVSGSPNRLHGLHEAEAYALQRSPQTVLALLESSCRGRTA